MRDEDRGKIRAGNPAARRMSANLAATAFLLGFGPAVGFAGRIAIFLVKAVEFATFETKTVQQCVHKASLQSDQTSLSTYKEFLSVVRNSLLANFHAFQKLPHI